MGGRRFFDSFCDQIWSDPGDLICEVEPQSGSGWSGPNLIAKARVNGAGTPLPILDMGYSNV
jgi:hypothetical protein